MNHHSEKAGLMSSGGLSIKRRAGSMHPSAAVHASANDEKTACGKHG
ncbi:MAG: hypothetical protein ACXWTP_08355 [Methylosarcina sp.]